MKLITLNIWGGKLGQRLLDFFKKHEDVDIFCLQEVFDGGETSLEIYKDDNMNIFNEISATLPAHQGYFHASEGNQEGLAIFVKKDIKINEVCDIFVHRWKDAMENNDSRTLGRNLQYISFVEDQKQYLVCNFHGLWNGQGKTDTEDRLKQSEKISHFLDSRKEEKKIIAGDFNLLPNTESVKIFEKSDLRNLVKDYEVTSTRTSHYAKADKYADYIFTARSVNVRDFQVLPDEVSDHAPLLLEFE